MKNKYLIDTPPTISGKLHIGRIFSYTQGDIAAYNKFQNAKKFIHIQISNGWIGDDEELFNEWLKYKYSILKSFDEYNFTLASELIYEFLWNIFCDKWIENSKKEPISNTLDKILKEFEPIFNIIYG